MVQGKDIRHVSLDEVEKQLQARKRSQQQNVAT
jgi:hypothetical protein